MIINFLQDNLKTLLEGKVSQNFDLGSRFFFFLETGGVIGRELLGTTLGRRCIQRFSLRSLSACPDLVSGGEQMKHKIEISNPSNNAGCWCGHLLKCLVTVVS